jgi:hypothetical protein
MSIPLFPLDCVVIVEYERDPLGAMFGVVLDFCELSLSCITLGRFACKSLSPLTTYYTVSLSLALHAMDDRTSSIEVPWFRSGPSSPIVFAMDAASSETCSIGFASSRFVLSLAGGLVESE